jgi:hypothetical protein
MRKIIFLTAFIAALSAGTAAAQTERRMATVAGGMSGDEGKCTIEVRVDGAAEVELRGEQGILRTLSGRPARWVRFECNGRMPLNPADFRYEGVDGRGRQELVRDPRNNRGVAVIAINDPSGGDEGYTFDVHWRGGAAYSSNVPLYGRDDRYAADVNTACADAVRQRAVEEYNARDVRMGSAAVDPMGARRDRLTGSVELLRGNRWVAFEYSCTVNTNTGRVGRVTLTRGGGALSDSGTYFPQTGRSDRLMTEDDCSRAAEERLRLDGYRNIGVSGMSGSGSRRHGTATARRQGQVYDFDVACVVNPNTGNVRSVNVSPR